LKSGYANLLIGGLHHAIQENGVPGMRSALRAFRVCVRAAGFVGHDSCGERSRTISRAVNRSKVNAALQLAEKLHFRRLFVAQALLPVLCFLPFDQPRTAKSGCATNFFRKLFSHAVKSWKIKAASAAGTSDSEFSHTLRTFWPNRRQNIQRERNGPKAR
jgi:hypothetical protein